MSVILLVLSPVGPAGAGHDDDPSTKNLHSMGDIEEPASLLAGAGGGNIQTDIAFRGNYAFQGSWLGFNIRDVKAPGNPKQVSFTSCTGNQGDVVVWDDILVRSWNSPAGMGATCDGEQAPEGFEGLHVFDISDLDDPVLVAAVELKCGSHTATGVPDVENDRLLVHSSSSGPCLGIDIVEVPLGGPAAAALIRTEPADRDCHDTAVVLGDAMKAVCAGDDGYVAWTLTGSGSLVDPDFLYRRRSPAWGSDTPHRSPGTASSSCSATSQAVVWRQTVRHPAPTPTSRRSSSTPRLAPSWARGCYRAPSPTSRTARSTTSMWSPCRAANYRLVSGNYQSGTSVVDSTDPTNAVEIAFSDPPPITPPGGPFCGGLGCEVGGAWSSYWYNNFIFETNITEGLNVFRFSGNETAGALELDHLNPQTQEFTLP